MIYAGPLQQAGDGTGMFPVNRLWCKFAGDGSGAGLCL